LPLLPPTHSLSFLPLSPWQAYGDGNYQVDEGFQRFSTLTGGFDSTTEERFFVLNRRSEQRVLRRQCSEAQAALKKWENSSALEEEKPPPPCVCGFSVFVNVNEHIRRDTLYIVTAATVYAEAYSLFGSVTFFVPPLLVLFSIVRSALVRA
jgi:hypothetical protein